MKLENIVEISNEVKVKGVVSLPSILFKSDIDQISSFLNKSFKENKGNNKSYFPVFFRDYLIKVLKFDFKKINQSIILKKIAKKLNFEKIAKNFFESEVKLQMIDSYYNEISNEKIISWHNDIGFYNINPESKEEDVSKFFEAAEAFINKKKNSKTPRGLKFFIHLTDVERKNGSLAVIPGSHDIVRNITKFILEKKIKLEKYWSLEDLRKLVLDKETQKLLVKNIGEKKLNLFLDHTQFIDKNPSKDTDQFDLQMSKGGLIIFDELCVHRGSAPQKNSRLVLRFIYTKK